MSTGQKWSHLLENTSEEFKNITKIVSYLLSVPATSAFTERVFSVMNAKWREDRNRATINLIKNELLIYFNFNYNCSEAFEVFKKDFKLTRKYFISCKKSWQPSSVNILLQNFLSHNTKMVCRILELYSGIGGMHCAWNESGLRGQIITAVDVNTVANEVYRHNFPGINLIGRNIQSLTPKEIEKLDVNTVLMSPPCQPFSRNGKYLDNNDPRANSFIYLIEILPELHKIEYILMENVKGFENSTVRSLFLNKLKECNFVYQEFLLCPTSIGVPNSRLRYYCIARKDNSRTWNFKSKNEIMLTLPKEYPEPYSLNSVLENNVPEKYLVPQKLLKRANIFDICHRDSRRSCCFTKAYSHYIEGAGSFYTEASPDRIKEALEKANSFELGSDEFIQTITELQLRYFTPKEVLALMSFPDTYSFPSSTTTKQCYRLLGNSVNVKVISELLKLLFD